MATLSYTKRGQQQRRQSALLSAVYEDFTNWYQLRRPEWNRMGPQLPLWFQRQIKRVDPRLCLQFVPPKSEEIPDGGPTKWKNGAWHICSEIPRSRWLARRSVFVLVEQNGEIIEPDHELIPILLHARRLRRNCQIGALDELYEQQVDQLMHENDNRERNVMLEQIRQNMRKRNMVNRYTSRVFVPSVN